MSTERLMRFVELTDAQTRASRAKQPPAAAFVGLSGLAWGIGTQMRTITGLTYPPDAFQTPHCVIDDYAWSSRWNDMRHRDTPPQVECTRLIISEHEIEALRAVPGLPPNVSDRGQFQ